MIASIKWSLNMLFKKTILLILLILTFNCNIEKPVDTSNKIEPIDTTGTPIDTTITMYSFVGSYITIDTKDITGIENGWFEWEQDENNPVGLSLHANEGAKIHKVGLIKEGIYKIVLTVKEKFEGENILYRCGFIIAVAPRTQVIFEDPSLEVSVRIELKKPEGPLTESDLLSLTNLNAVFEDITSLYGIERCKNLQHLNLTDNRIIDLTPISQLTQLTYLDIDQNRDIVDISPISGLIELRHLDISSNEIVDISVLSNLKKLTYLKLNYNPINDISVLSNFKDLEELWMGHSPIDGDIYVLSGLSKLKLLWMSNCNIKDISPIKNLTDLEKIFFSYNQIEDISPLANLTKLTFLYLEYNQIEDISVLENLVNLIRLRLRHNKIKDILPLVNNKGLGPGDYVTLSGNPLNEISINTYIPLLEERGYIVFYSGN